MITPAPPVRAVINMMDPAKAGLLQSPLARQTLSHLPLQTSSEAVPWTLRVVAPSGAAFPPWQDVLTDGAQFQLTVARAGASPVAGTNAFTRNADGVSWDAVLVLATDAMAAAFAAEAAADPPPAGPDATAADAVPPSLAFTCQVDLLLPGAAWMRTILQAPMRVSRSVLAAGTVAASGGILGRVRTAQTLTAAGGALTPVLGSPGADAVCNAAALTAPLSVHAPAGQPEDGQVLTFRFAQDAAGGHALAWDAAYLFPPANPASSLPLGPNARYELTFGYHAAAGVWRARGVAGPF